MTRTTSRYVVVDRLTDQAVTDDAGCELLFRYVKHAESYAQKQNNEAGQTVRFYVEKAAVVW